MNLSKHKTTNLAKTNVYFFLSFIDLILRHKSTSYSDLIIINKITVSNSNTLWSLLTQTIKNLFNPILKIAVHWMVPNWILWDGGIPSINN